MGLPCVCTTALISVAEKVGTNRIFYAGGKFHYPWGEPNLPPEKEFAWRKRMAEAGLKYLQTPVEGVEVKTIDQLLA